MIQSITSPEYRETIIVIGAGAAGLMAAWQLSSAGKATILLEAAGAPGGRIRTLEEKGFVRPVEAGAEFVHGALPLTLQLLEQAGLSLHPVKGKMVHVRKGNWGGRGLIPGGWGKLMEKMQQLGEDMPLSVFLSTRFPGKEYAGLRDAARRYAEGFDLADVYRASTLALYKEWSHEEGGQTRIEGGYGRLVDWLAEQCRLNGCLIHLSAAVEKIVWEQGRITVTTTGGNIFNGSRAILAVPLGILQNSYAASHELGEPDEPIAPAKHGSGPAGRGEAIRFDPTIDETLRAACRLGYGHVIKVLVQFKERLWDRKEKKLGFILSDQAVPTWWTQYPDDNPLLTGWIPGAAIRSLQAAQAAAGESLLELSLSSLASIFATDKTALKEQLAGVKVVDWSAEPFIRGGYSYETVESAAARKIVNQPVKDTLFFAGEALYDGDAPATVEAALSSGKATAEKIIALTEPRQG